MPNAPRTADLDLLYCDEVTISEEDFILPHPGVFGRAFVLMPLAGIRPVLIPAEVDAAEVVEGMLVGGGAAIGLVRSPRL